MEQHRKVAAAGQAVERLRREAELLAAARHPGVVEFLRLEHEGQNLALVTALVDGQPLSAYPSLPPEELAGLGSALATTLGDLHELGLVHGSVSADHVIVRVDGRPVLCGFGSGGRSGERVPDRSSPLDAGGDLEGLGRILRHFAVGPEARVLREMARSAIESAGSGPAPARRLAADLSSALAGARLPTKFVDEKTATRDRMAMPRPQGRHPSRTAGRAAGLGALLLAAVLGIAYWTGASTDGIHEDRVPAATSLSPTVAAPTSVLRGSGPLHGGSSPKEWGGSASRTGPECPEAAGLLIADVDGDGCEEVLTFEDGVLTAGARRWQLGRAGDIAVTGDWACTGRRDVTLLRPSSGEVFHFDGWAVAGNDVVADRLGRVDGARAVRAADLNGDGCHELAVERSDGTIAILEPGTPAS